MRFASYCGSHTGPRETSLLPCAPDNPRGLLAIVLIVPMCLLASVTGLLARGLPIDILAQIGFVVLVGLAAKNAILIVEFARHMR